MQVSKLKILSLSQYFWRVLFNDINSSNNSLLMLQTKGVNKVKDDRETIISSHGGDR